MINENAITYRACAVCGNLTFRLRQANMHKGLYCANCGRWLKWATKSEAILFEFNDTNMIPYFGDKE